MLKKIFFLSILLFAVFFLYPQESPRVFKDEFYVPHKRGFSQAWKAVLLGDKFYNERTRGGYLYALENYKVAYRYNPDNAALNYKIGVCYLKTVYKDSALFFLRKAYRLNKHIVKDFFWQLGQAFQYRYQFDSAIAYFEKYKASLTATMLITYGKDIDRKIFECYNAKELVKHPVNVKIENVREVNTIYPEYSPIVTADESELYFTARRPDCIGGEVDYSDGQYYEDIFVVFRQGAHWSNVYNVGPPINTRFHDATVGITPDGRRMIIFRDGDLYISTRHGDRWGYPEPLPEVINTDSSESHACFTYDGKTLYFVRGKEPGSPTSNGDIYVSHYVNGRWTEPRRLPDNVNTPFDEDGVFMMPDGKTLYFSSRGHNTMGGYDIFVTQLNDDGSWSDPVNIGYPINTPDDDIYITLSASGVYGYYSSVRKDARGYTDIYRITFLDRIPLFLASENNLIADLSKPSEEMVGAVSFSPITLVVGYVRDKKTHKPIHVDIQVFDLDKDSLILETESNEKTGKFLITLPAGHNYGLMIKKQGYMFYSENFNLPADEAYKKVEKIIELPSIEEGARTVLSNIFFDFNSSKLKKESYAELNQIVEFLKDNPSVSIEISGHTDNIGSREYNLRLSEERARAVANYLIDHGISPDRLKYRGAGFDEPIAPNDTPEGRQKNRRVEFKIISY